MENRQLFGLCASFFFSLLMIPLYHLWHGLWSLPTSHVVFYASVICIGIVCTYVTADLFLFTPKGVNYPIIDSLKICLAKRWLFPMLCSIYYKKFIKETKDSKGTQERYLLNLLQVNSGSIYGQKFKFDEIKCREEFVRRVPLTKQSDIAPYCHMISRGEKNVLTREDPVMMALTTGTTGANCPIPVIASSADTVSRYLMAILTTHTQSIFPEQRQLRKTISFMYSTPMGKTEGGLMVGPVSHYYLNKGKSLSGAFYTSPLELFDLVTSRQDIEYLMLLFGLLDRTINCIQTGFSIILYNIMMCMENNWQKLVEEIRTGRLQSGFETDPEILRKIEKYITPNPARADEIQRECRKGFVGIIGRVWPDLQYINVLTTGTMQLYADMLNEKYTKGMPLYSLSYGSTEGFGGVNIAHLSESPRYTFTQNTTFYEFIEEEDMDEEEPRTYFSEQVTVGKNYEVVYTNLNGMYRYRFGDVMKVVGFYNTAPTLEYKFRKGQLLNLVNEKTSEVSVLETVTQTVQQWPGCILHDYTCAVNAMAESATGNKSRPGPYYIFFIELRHTNGQERILTDEDKSLMDSTLRSISQLYDIGRRKNIIKPILVYTVREGTFDDLKKYIFEITTASFNQFKMPRVLKREALVKFMLDNVKQ